MCWARGLVVVSLMAGCSARDGVGAADLVLQLQNADGKFVSPDDKTFVAAAAGADWFSVPGMGVSMVNAKGDSSWPISTASFILMHKQPADKAQSAEVLKFFDWAFRNGDKTAEELDYIPMPANVKDMIRKTWSADIKS